MITVFGSVNLDLIGSVERLPKPGETVPGGDFRTSPGGKGANQALAAARAGAPVRMVGGVGNDSFAGEALALLREGGVDLASIRTVGGPTGVALILVESSGENVIAVIPGANGQVNEADAAAVECAPDDVLLLQLEVPVSAVEAAARSAGNVGARVLLNFAPFRPDALGLIQHATHLLVNETELEFVAAAFALDQDDVDGQAAALARKIGKALIVTLGADGALAIENSRHMRAPTLPVQAIDTVGAGDAFCGYFASALSEGLPLDQALRRAATAGSLACTKAGAQPSIPFRAEVEAALSR